MSAPSDNMEVGISDEKTEVCEIEATIVTGFESIAKDEAEEKLGAKTSIERGKLNFEIPVQDVKKILELQSVDNLFVIMKRYPVFAFAETEEGALEQIYNLIPEADWDLGLRVWSQFFSFPHHISPLPKEQDKPDTQTREKTDAESKADLDASDKKDLETDSEKHGDADNTAGKQGEDTEPDVKKPKVLDPNMPSFRATCYRSGGKHAFQSPQAAAHFGGAIQDYFGWNVNLKNFDIEAVLTVEEKRVYLSLALTKESRHKRNLVQFGPTSLRPTIAYGMLRLCQIQPGDVVCDPMCGGGSIPIEAYLNWQSAHHLCGDFHEQAAPRSATNIQAVLEQHQANGKMLSSPDIFRWDAGNLPLKTNSVDVFITDMPFGKRSGSRWANRELYPRVLKELARVCRQNTGRACLLTQDKKCLMQSMRSVAPYWKRGATLGINVGGLAAAVYVLYRTGQPLKTPRTEQDAAEPT